MSTHQESSDEIVISVRGKRFCIPDGAMEIWNSGAEWYMDVRGPRVFENDVISTVRNRLKLTEDENEKCCGTCTHAIFESYGKWACPMYPGMRIINGFDAANRCTDYSPIPGKGKQ